MSLDPYRELSQESDRHTLDEGNIPATRSSPLGLVIAIAAVVSLALLYIATVYIPA